VEGLAFDTETKTSGTYGADGHAGSLEVTSDQFDLPPLPEFVEVTLIADVDRYAVLVLELRCRVFGFQF
jgi:hypothetical protein